MEEKIIIGRRETVNFPELNLLKIPAKTDTGAYTSSIHCSNIKENPDGLYCNFNHAGIPGIEEKLVFSEFTRKRVRSSNGEMQNRYKVHTLIEVHNKCYNIELTLANRSKMRYPVLLGRKFLKGKFLVDVSLKKSKRI